MSALPNTAVVPTPRGVSDERLAARVASDPTAFTELHERYEQSLLRYTRSLLRDPHDAADAAQDAWTRAFAALRESPVRVLSVRSWLFAVARNAAMDRIRDGKRCTPADIDERALGASPAPDEVLELRTRAREALSDLAGLSERQRTALVLRDLHGLTGDELACALDTDIHRVSWLLTDARRSLGEVRSGRGLSCETARCQLDTKRVRTRAVRAHLADCPACDGYARRRVASRLHAFAVLLLAVPARLRAAMAGGLDTVKPVGAIAAATLAAGVPAVHELHRGHTSPRVPPAATTLMPHRPSSAPAVTLLTTAPPARRHAQARAVVAPRAMHIRRGAAPSAPAWHMVAPAAARAPHAAPQQPAAPILPVPAVAPLSGAIKLVANTVTAVAPAAAPVVAVVSGTLAPVTG